LCVQYRTKFIYGSSLILFFNCEQNCGLL
jgi:hypothetical protein